MLHEGPDPLGRGRRLSVWTNRELGIVLDALSAHPTCPSSYDILLEDKIIGSVVKGGSRDTPVWIAELLNDPPPERRPPPFTMIEHPFRSFEDVRVWLGYPQAKPDPLSRLAS